MISRNNLYPISAVIPVYQCADRLVEHARMIRNLRPSFGEVIWVCTRSEDGSHEIARREANSNRELYLEAPPGLYAAWNLGIAHATCKFTYISTVGELMLPDGLSTMLDRMIHLQASVLFSPPKIVPASRENLRRTRHWPVFQYRHLLRLYHGRIVPTPVLARIQLLAGISCLLGSCASCLFETSFLQKHPFPTGFYHYGDTAWFYSHMTSLRVAYLSKPFTTFHVHDHSRRKIDPQHQYQCIHSFIEAYQKRYPHNDLLAWARALGIARLRLNDLRQPHPYRYWWLNPSAWWWRFIRVWTLRIIHAELLARVFLGLVGRHWMRWQSGKPPDGKVPSMTKD